MRKYLTAAVFAVFFAMLAFSQDAFAITVDGVVYLSNEITPATGKNGGPCDDSTEVISVVCSSDTKTLYPGTCSSSDASFSIDLGEAGVAGDTITVFLTSAMKANTVYVTDGNNNSGIDLYQNTVVVGNVLATSLANSDIGYYDSTDNNKDMLYDVDGTLVVEDGVELHIRAGNTFLPGNTVTTSPSNDGTDTNKDGDIHIPATSALNMGTYALSVGGDLINANDFLYTTAQTTTFTATATGHTIDIGDGSGNNLSNVVFNGSGGGWSFNDASNTIDGTLTMTAGTLSGTNNITVNGGSVTGAGDINMTGGTFTIDGTGNLGGTAAWDFNNLTLGDGAGAATTTASGAGGITLAGNLVVNTSQILAGTGNMNVMGGGVSGSGDINLTGGTFLVDGTGNFAGTLAWDFYDLTFGNGVDTTTTASTGAGGVTVANVLTIAANQTLDAKGRTWTLSGTTGTPFVITGTFNDSTNTSTFKFTGDYGSGNTTIPASTAYHSIEIDRASETYAIGNNSELSGNLTLTNGNLTGTNLNVYGGSVTGNGDLSISGTLKIRDSGSFGGDTEWEIATLWLGDNSTVKTTTSTGSGNIIISGYLYVLTNHTLDPQGKTWTLSNASGTNAVVFYLYGAIDDIADTSTFKFTGNYSSGNTLIPPSTGYHNITLDNAAEIFYCNASATYTLSGNLTVTNGELINANGSNWTVNGGSVTGNGDINIDSGTFTINGAGSLGGTTAWDFNDLTLGDGIDGPDTITASGAGGITLAGDLVVNSDQVLAGTGSMTVNGGGVTGNGDINLTGGSFTVKGTGNFGGDTNWDFYSLYFEDTIVGLETTTATGTGSITMAAASRLYAVHTLDPKGKTWTLTGAGTTFRIDGTLDDTVNTSTFTFTGTGQTIWASTGYHNITVSNESAGVFALNGITSLSGDLTVTVGTLRLNNYAFTVGGATSVTGTIDTSIGSTGTRTFTGLVTVNSGGTFDLSGQNPATSFGAGITQSSSNLMNIGSGASALVGNLAGAGAGGITFGGALTISNGTTTNNYTGGTTTVTGLLTLAGNWTQGNGSTLSLGLGSGSPFAGAGTFTASTNSNTVNYSGADQTCKVVTYHHLNLTGSGTVTCAVTTVNGNLSTSGTVSLTTGANLVVTGTLTVGTGTVMTTGANYTLDVTGTTTVNGTGNLALSNGGAKVLNGAVTVNSGGVFTVGGGSVEFKGNFTNNSGSTITIASPATFTTLTANSLAGAYSITFSSTVVVGSTGRTWTNNNTGTITINGTLTLTGNWTQGASSTLVLGAATPFAGAGTFTASTNSNTVNYSGANQTCKVVTYHHLNLTGSGTVTCAVTTVNGNLSTSGTVSLTTGANLGISGTLTIGTGTTFTTGANYTLNVTGTTTVNGTGNLALSNGGAKTLIGAVAINDSGTFTVGGGSVEFRNGFTNSTEGLITIASPATFTTTASQSISGVSDVTFSSTVGIGTGVTLTNNAAAITINGLLTLTGNWTQGNGSTLILSSGSGSPFSGAGTLDTSTNANTVTYVGSSQTVKAITYRTLSVTGTASIDGTVTVNTALSGAGTLTNNATGVLNIGFSSAPTITTLTATASGNTVNYTAASPNCKVVAYHHLNFTGSGTVTCAVTVVGGDLGLSGTVSWPTSSDVVIGGDLTVGSGTALTGTNSITVNGGGVTGDGDIDMSSGSFTVIGTGNFGGATAWDFSRLFFGDGKADTTTAMGNAITVDDDLSVAVYQTVDFETNDSDFYVLDDFNNAGTFTASSSGVWEVGGDYTNSGTLNENSSTLTLNGATSINLITGCSDFTSCTDQDFNNIYINKTAGADTDDNVTLYTNDLRFTGTLAIADGELVQGALDVWAGGASAVSIDAAGKWTNISTGDLKLGGTFANAGTATFNSNNGSQCIDIADDIVITSTSGGQVRTWSGVGTYTMRNVDVTDMSDGAITITTETSTLRTNTDWTVYGCGSSSGFFSIF